MFKKSILTLLLIPVLTTAVQAQETEYTAVSFSHKVLPTLPQYSDYKSFDLTVLTTKENQDAPGTGFNMAFQPKAASLTQVADGGDFHIVSLLQRYGGKMVSTAAADISVILTSTVYDKYGNIVKKGTVNNEHFAVNFGRNLSKEESGNADLVRKMCMEKIIEASLQQFVEGVSGATLKPVARIATLSGIKKKPALSEFNTPIKALTSALEKDGLVGLQKTAAANVPFWESMTNYNAEGEKDEDKNEVKRAAYQNLALYHIAAGNIDKAREYIALYKPIDKQIKEMLGLIKYKNSEELEKLMETVNPAAPEATPVAATGTIMTKAQIADNFQYMIIDGTATISGKKIAGTYEGIIKVYKIPANSFGGIVNLDPENISVKIETKDAGGQPKTINTYVSNIEELKDKSGVSYTTQKFGTKIMGDQSFNFMKSTFTSPRVTVYRSLIPETGDYVVKKAGDEKGVKSSLMNARKNLEEYLNDCPALVEKFKSGAIDKKATAEIIAEEYSNCK
jgi:hypothetical protein